ncbi:MAG: hypothetical protein IJ608_03970 [Lachnospiraceae bacterium]|nr:hypothetical protein [Lachnospiraceae bacterium]
MSKWEQKFGKYAVPNLTVILLICYVVGYVLQMFAPTVLYYLTLNPYEIVRGQVWRIFTWVLLPPSSFNIFFTLIMLYFYYSIGTVLERTWGTWRYNVYIFGGMLFTVIASFLCFGVIMLLKYAGVNVVASIFGSTDAGILFTLGSMAFSTYYINISIFLLYAMTYPDMRILFMFFIPIKVKWLGILDLILLVFELVFSNLFSKFAVSAALINVFLFYLINVRRISSPKQIKRRMEFERRANPVKITKHKCAICGQTDESAPNLQFRFCSKCNGNYEYCSEHLFTHEHVK